MTYGHNLVAIRMSMKEVVLVVADTHRKSDIKNAVVRVNPETMRRLGVDEGDVLEIETTRKHRRITGATVLPSTEDDQDSIGVTGTVRRNAAVSLGDTVIVRKAEVANATSVVLAPVDMIVSIDEDFIAYMKNEALAKRPLLEGDVQVAFLLGHPIAFRVVRTEPKGFVRMHETTALRIQEKFDGHNYYEQE